MPLQEIMYSHKQKKGIKHYEKHRYFVFIEDYAVKDAQAFLQKPIPQDLFADEQEDGWSDISCPALVLDRCFTSREELKTCLQTLYPNADLNIFAIYEYPADIEPNYFSGNMI